MKRKLWRRNDESYCGNITEEKRKKRQKIFSAHKHKRNKKKKINKKALTRKSEELSFKHLKGIVLQDDSRWKRASKLIFDYAPLFYSFLVFSWRSHGLNDFDPFIFFCKKSFFVGITLENSWKFRKIFIVAEVISRMQAIASWENETMRIRIQTLAWTYFYHLSNFHQVPQRKWGRKCN